MLVSRRRSVRRFISSAYGSSFLLPFRAFGIGRCRVWRWAVRLGGRRRRPCDVRSRRLGLLWRAHGCARKAAAGGAEPWMAEGRGFLGRWARVAGRVIHRLRPSFLVFILFFLVFKSRKRFLKQGVKMPSCYKNMVCCYRFTVRRLQIYGQVLQKYGAVHGTRALLLQIYGRHPRRGPVSRSATDLWSGGRSVRSATDLWFQPCCYRFMVRGGHRPFCYRFMVRRGAKPETATKIAA